MVRPSAASNLRPQAIQLGQVQEPGGKHAVFDTANPFGRDMVREAAAALPEKIGPGSDTLLRLEHLIITHQGRPEWGSPKPPMTPEALLVHYADDIDAKYQMMVAVLRDDTNPGPVTSKKNILMQHVYRGE